MDTQFAIQCCGKRRCRLILPWLAAKTNITWISWSYRHRSSGSWPPSELPVQNHFYTIIFQLFPFLQKYRAWFLVLKENPRISSMFNNYKNGHVMMGDIWQAWGWREVSTHTRNHRWRCSRLVNWFWREPYLSNVTTDYYRNYHRKYLAPDQGELVLYVQEVWSIFIYGLSNFFRPILYRNLQNRMGQDLDRQ